MDAVIGLDKSNGISGFAKFSVFFVENYKNAKIQNFFLTFSPDHGM